MPGTQVPGLQNSTPQFSQNVPGVQLPYRGEFTREGLATENLGESVEKLAAVGGDISEEIQRQHDISVASKNYVDSGVAHAEQMQTLKLTSPDGFVRDPHTNEVIKNPDGTQRTIAQDYWNWADSDYQNRQRDMSPRAAAMFRQQMLPEIGGNTKVLQNQALEIQRDSANTDVGQSMLRYSQDNDRSPYPAISPYYNDVRPDGSVNMRGSTAKINDQLRTLQLWTQRQGPANGKPGMYTQPEIARLSSDRLSKQSDEWVRSATTDILENDTPRDHRNKISTTAVQQVLNLRDVIEGKDPESKRAQAMGLPTVNSSLTSEQADQWRTHLNSMLDGARKIDRSDYEFQLSNMKESAKSGKYQTPDQLFQSPEFRYLVHAASPLQLTPEEQLKNFSEIFSNAAGSSYGGAGFDLSSEAAKRQQIMQRIDGFAAAWPKYGAQLGANFTGNMAEALKAEVTKGALSNLEQETRQFQSDPAKYAAGVASGYQDPTKGVKYRSPMMKYVEDKLYSDPSLFAATNLMTNGGTVIGNAVSTMKRVGAQGFGQGFQPTYLSKNDYEVWASKIEKQGTPEQVEDMFQRLHKAIPKDADAVVSQLVKAGNLDPRYQIAQNLPTAQARIAAYAEIQSKGAAIDALEKSGGETAAALWKRATQANAPSIDFSNRLHGSDSPEASKNLKMLNQTWMSAYASAKSVGGTSDDEATKAANERVAAQIPPVATVGERHNFLGFQWGSSGPQSKVKFSRPDLAPEQQDAIRANLLKAQKDFANSNYEPVKAPVVRGAYDFNSKLDNKWVSEHPFIWYPTHNNNGEAVYRLQYQGMNADGSPNGRGYDLKVYGPDGSPRYYEVKESDALKKQGH